MNVLPANLTEEELRIAAVYARRKQSIPGRRYCRLSAAHLCMVQELERELLRLFRRCSCDELSGRRILEIGCGTGNWLRTFIQWGARPENLYGVELLNERLDEARQLLPPTVVLVRGNAAHLDFSDEAMDMVAQFCVFSSILNSDIRRQVAQEMVRVLRPGGYIVSYDFHFDNPNNPDVSGLKRNDIVRLFPHCRADFCRLTVAPPLARALVRVSPKLYPITAAMKVLCTHYLVLLQKNALPS